MGHKKPHREAKPTGQFPKAHAMSLKSKSAYSLP